MLKNCFTTPSIEEQATPKNVDDMVALGMFASPARLLGGPHAPDSPTACTAVERKYNFFYEQCMFARTYIHSYLLPSRVITPAAERLPTVSTHQPAGTGFDFALNRRQSLYVGSRRSIRIWF
jgi:hypothetical protein